ncbi:MAG: transporter [Verrucomicrobiota bacterium]
MKKTIIRLFIGVALFATPSMLQAFAARPIVAGHYPAGVEGIKGSSLPPPGVYFRDYNLFYSADHFDGGPPDFDIFAYVNAPRLIWMTDCKILGADYGMDIIVPFGYLDWHAGGKDYSYSGIGDIQLEPLLLSWHFQQFDVAAGYAVWAPTGDFRVGRPDILAKGFWSHMLTLGGTWYFDAEKTWALSLLNRYEFCHEQEDTSIDPGQVYTLEFALSKAVTKTLDVGVIGYWQQQTTQDSGPFASRAHDRKVGLGAEISGVCPLTGLLGSLRYAYEMAAVDRPEGHLVAFTLTKRF